MKTLPLAEVEPGMVLAMDLLSADGRVLLKEGTVLQDSHIQGLGRRGVSALQVQGDEADPEAPLSEADMALLQASQDYVHSCFVFVDPDHPAMQELYRLCVLRTFREMQQGLKPPSAQQRADAETQNLEDLFLKEQGTPEDVVLHEVQLASFPDVYFKIVAVLRSPTASAKRIAEVVSQDSSLTAKLLKLVNSPFYGFPSRIDSLSRAVALLGGNELSTLALGISAINVFKDIPPQLVDMHSFWTHSLRCAIFAKLIGSRLDKSLQERHFVSGLLHDIGKLLLYKKLPYAASQALVYSRANGVPEFEAEKEVMGFDHMRIGMLLMKEWNFPDTLINSLAKHHRPNSGDDLGPCVVHAADIMSVVAGISEGQARMVPQLSPACWDRLKLDAAELPQLFKEQETLLHRLAGVFF